MSNQIVSSLHIAQGKNLALEQDEKEQGKNQTLISNELYQIEQSIDPSLIIEESRELDIELHNAIKNEVDGAILEETKKVMKKQGSKLTQALVTRLYDRANQIGKAYLMKKVLKAKKPLWDALEKVAKGGTYTERRVIRTADGGVTEITITKEMPPNTTALKYLFNKIDGSSHIAIAIEEKEQRSIDDIIANDTINLPQ